MLADLLCEAHPLSYPQTFLESMWFLLCGSAYGAFYHQLPFPYLHSRKTFHNFEFCHLPIKAACNISGKQVTFKWKFERKLRHQLLVALCLLTVRSGKNTETLVRKVDDYIYCCVETDALTIQKKIVCMFQHKDFLVHFITVHSSYVSPKWILQDKMLQILRVQVQSIIDISSIIYTRRAGTSRETESELRLG